MLELSCAQTLKLSITFLSIGKVQIHSESLSLSLIFSTTEREILSSHFQLLFSEVRDVGGRGVHKRKMQCWTALAVLLTCRKKSHSDTFAQQERKYTRPCLLKWMPRGHPPSLMFWKGFQWYPLLFTRSQLPVSIFIFGFEASQAVSLPKDELASRKLEPVHFCHFTYARIRRMDYIVFVF